MPGQLGRLKPRRRRPASDDGSMSLIEHLFELRTRVTVAAIAVVLTTIIGFIRSEERRVGKECLL